MSMRRRLEEQKQQDECRSASIAEALREKVARCRDADGLRANRLAEHRRRLDCRAKELDAQRERSDSARKEAEQRAVRSMSARAEALRERQAREELVRRQARRIQRIQEAEQEALRCRVESSARPGA